MDAESHDSGAGTILVVDDNENCRKMLQRLLRSHGWTVCGAVSGNEAAQVYRAVRPDVVLTDLSMPGGDGNSLIAELQRTDPGVCIIAMTGLSRQDLRVQQATRKGARTVLIKPFDGATLEAAIQTALHPAA
jgi:CheY-like chemotaxis protein